MKPAIQRIDLGFVNAYLVSTGKGFVLVDTGVPASRPALEEALRAAGCTPARLSLVVLTHGDPDHLGNAAWLQSTYGAKVAMHPGDAPMAESGAEPVRRATRLYVRIAFGWNRLRRRLAVLRRRGRPSGPSADGVARFSPDILLADGQSLAPYGWDAHVLHCPGHTAGSVSILAHGASGVELLVGDTLTAMFRPDTAMLVENAIDYRRTLARIRALSVETILPGHGRPFPPGRLFRNPKGRRERP